MLFSSFLHLLLFFLLYILYEEIPKEHFLCYTELETNSIGIWTNLKGVKNTMSSVFMPGDPLPDECDYCNHFCQGNPLDCTVCGSYATACEACGHCHYCKDFTDV